MLFALLLNLHYVSKVYLLSAVWLKQFNDMWSHVTVEGSHVSHGVILDLSEDLV